MKLGFGGQSALAGFDPPRRADGCRIRSDGRERSAATRAAFGPGGHRAVGCFSRLRPKLWPGSRGTARADRPCWAA